MIHIVLQCTLFSWIKSVSASDNYVVLRYIHIGKLITRDGLDIQLTWRMSLKSIDQLGIVADVTVIFEDFEFAQADKMYFLEPESYITDDQEMFVNVTILKSFPEHSQTRLAMFGLSQGEYVLPSGMDIRMELCDMVSETFIMGALLQDFGFSSDDCPPHPGVYGSQGYSMDTTNFPDTFPRNKYLAIFSLDDDGNNILTVHIYLEVQ